jgi:CHAT domain-containing protein/tetratricopeptide (TPR) repeat protein
MVDDLVDLVLARQRLGPYRDALRAAQATLIAHPAERDSLAERLKVEADRHWTIDAHSSLRLARAIILLGRLTADQAIIALGTMARADALRLLGEPRFALALLERAAALFRRCDDEVGWARTRISAMGAQISLGQLQEALAESEQARPILRQRGDLPRLVRLDFNSAFVYELIGKREKALELWEAVIVACQDPAMPGRVELHDMARLNRAMTLHRLGHLTEALASLREIRAHFTATNQRLGAANADWLIGFVLLFQGRYGPALRAFEDAQAAFEVLEMPVDVARVGCEMLECYLAAGRPERVQTLAPPLATLLDQHGLALEYVLVGLHQAEALRQLGNVAAALEILDAIADRLATMGLAVWQARCALAGARALLAQDTRASVDVTREALARAISVFREHGLPVETTQALLLDARALAATNRLAEAADRAAQALNAAVTLGLSDLVVSAHAFLADLNEASENLETAAASYTEAIVLMERMQQYMTLDLRRSFLSADPAAIYASAIRLSLRRGRVDETFDLVERAKSRALLDHVDAGVDLRLHGADRLGRDLIIELQAVRERYLLYSAALTGRASEQASSLLPALNMDQLLAEARACEERMRALIERIHLRNPAYSEGAALRGTRTIDPRPYLEPGDLLVNYYAANDDLIILTMDHKTLTATCLSGVWRLICGDVSLLHLNLESVAALTGTADALTSLPRLEAKARSLLRRLWDRLLAPVADRIAQASRLIVAPFGPLHYLPFQALHDGQRYLVERLPVSMSPSASVLAALHRRANRRSVDTKGGSGPPASNLLVGTTLNGRLPHVTEELNAVARHIGGQVLVDKAATREAVLSSVERARVFHIASHGFLHGRDALFSFVQLADAPLTTADILDLQLSGALVTLSACETGLGQLGGGDELEGLSRAFFYAGADALIFSLWRVEDRSTAHLMDALYAGIAAGQAKDAALRRAQLTLLHRSENSSDDSTTHPYFWAPFVLVGNNRPLHTS